MVGTFTAHLGAFRDKTKVQMQAVLSDSVQDVVREAQMPVAQGGRMPVDTGTLRNSLLSELNGSQVAEGPDSYVIVAEMMEPGDVARFGWGGAAAAYALRQHEGFEGEDALGRTYNQAGRHWIDGAAAGWQQIVAANVDKLK